LFADNIDRGISTGMVTGRDMQWLMAWQDFANRPFFGNGLSFYASEQSIGAHTPILYALSYFGILGFAFWVLIFIGIFIVARKNFTEFVLLSPSIIILIVNDRFLNSNSSPLFFYFYILKTAFDSRNLSNQKDKD
jgi:hypothetical protein